LIRGHTRDPARDRTACQVEWHVVTPANILDGFGLPSSTQQCRSGDATCDIAAFDAQGAPCPAPDNSAVCHYHVVVCVNNEDAKLPMCEAMGLRKFFHNQLFWPMVYQRRAVASTTEKEMVLSNRTNVLYALSHLHDPTIPCDPRTEDCWPVVGQVNANQKNLCSAPFEIKVVAGRTMRVKVTSKNAAGRYNSSALNLRCD